MKNKQKSRSGCRTCKLRRLRCDETKPACRNCTQKNLDCPGYQQRLQWSTKHEKPWTATTSGPENFNQLVSAASEVIAQPVAGESSRSAQHGSSTDEGSSSDDLSSTQSPSPPPKTDPEEQAAMVPFIKRDPSPDLDMSAIQQASPTSMVQPVVDIPSFLIEHWFKSVCGSWSAYDSQTNPYRQLTSNTWSTSRPVFYALQAISAASLVERLPHVMWDTARSAPVMATDAIKKELIAFRLSAGQRTKFPSELLLALFCMSSSMCWLESRELGLQYLRQARAVLKCLESWDLDEKEQELLGFFKGCLIYEEMLRSVVSDNDVDIKNMLSWPEPPEVSLVPVTPHPWTGVSSDVFRLFGKAVALCRKSRVRWRHNGGTSISLLQSAMKDIAEATAVEEALLAVNAQQAVQPGQTEEMLDAARHLDDCTEAYRLSSLLQLYESFPDLVMKRMPDLAESDGVTVWNTWVTPLAWHVSTILERIPVASMRCIQPLLCLCAGSGLRFETKVPMGSGHQSYLVNQELDVSTLPTDPLLPSTSPEVDPLLLGDNIISDNSIKTSQARRFLMDRLDQLEISLPPKPIGVAKELLRAVWRAYDEEIGTDRRTHWLDVMASTGLHSIFG